MSLQFIDLGLRFYWISFSMTSQCCFWRLIFLFLLLYFYSHVSRLNSHVKNTRQFLLKTRCTLFLFCFSHEESYDYYYGPHSQRIRPGAR